MYVLELVVSCIDVVSFAQEAVAIMNINVRASFVQASTKEEHLYSCGSEFFGDMGLVRRVVLVCWQHGIHVWTCGSQFVGNGGFAYKDVWFQIGWQHGARAVRRQF